LETYRQRAHCNFSCVNSGVTKAGVLGGARSAGGRSRNTGVDRFRRRIAYCECGAQLAGGSQRELFDAAQRHLAHHHPQLLGALELDVVQQMAEDVGG
jgi:hypothetical protein